MVENTPCAETPPVLCCVTPCAVCAQIAGQVLGEDLVLVRGQQARMEAGDDTWGTPMAYDKLAVRYRRWRNTVGGPCMFRAPTFILGGLLLLLLLHSSCFCRCSRTRTRTHPGGAAPWGGLS